MACSAQLMDDGGCIFYGLQCSYHMVVVEYTEDIINMDSITSSDRSALLTDGYDEYSVKVKETTRPAFCSADGDNKLYIPAPDSHMNTSLHIIVTTDNLSPYIS